jgi:nucleoside-diphosphate-sugar epimerase
MGNRLRTVLVTGGSGRIGRHVVARLRADGLQVLVLDVRADPAFAAAQGVSVFLADVRDDRSVAAAIENVDGVIHLAGVQNSVVEMVEHNIVGALNVLDAAMEFDIPTVLASKLSNDVLPDPDSVVTHAIERFGTMFRGELGSTVNVVRLADTYGPAPRGAQPKGIVARLLDQALHGEAIAVDSHRTVDAVHVRDVADVLVDALWYGAEVGNLPTAIELTSGLQLSALDVAAEVTGKVADITGAISKITTQDSQNYLDQKAADAASLDILYPEGKHFIEFGPGLEETLESARWDS